MSGNVHPLSAEGIKAFQEQQRKDRQPQGLVVPAARGSTQSSGKRSFARSSSRPLGQLAAQRRASAKGHQGPSSSSVIDDSDDVKPAKEMINFDEIKLEEPEEDEITSAKFIRVDVGEGVSVKLEVEEPIEEPELAPFREPANPFFQPIVKNASIAQKQASLAKQTARFQSATLERWQKTAQKTLKECTDGIKMAAEASMHDVSHDMIQSMADFLKPALMRLDQLEQQKNLHDPRSQESLEAAAAQLVARVSREEAGSYDSEFLPIVKLTRAFATFADRLAKLFESNTFPHPTELESASSSTSDLAQVLNDEAAKAHGLAADDFMDREEWSATETSSAWDDDDEIDDPAVKRVRQIVEEAAPVLVREGAADRRKINPIYMRTKPVRIPQPIVVRRSIIRHNCPYCGVEQPSELQLYDHVKRLHPHQWKKYAVFSCLLQPHCDNRFVKRAQLDAHVAHFHEATFRSWHAEGRMNLDDMNCPFCERRSPVRNVMSFHEHLDENHAKALTKAYEMNLPFIGCASCSFSSFWAYDVYKHWHEKPNCKGRLVLRNFERLKMLGHLDEDDYNESNAAWTRQLQEISQSVQRSVEMANGAVKLTRLDGVVQRPKLILRLGEGGGGLNYSSHPLHESPSSTSLRRVSILGGKRRVILPPGTSGRLPAQPAMKEDEDNPFGAQLFAPDDESRPIKIEEDEYE